MSFDYVIRCYLIEILLMCFCCLSVYLQTSLMLFSADEEADKWLCCALIPNSKAAKKDSNKWVQVLSVGCYNAIYRSR